MKKLFLILLMLAFVYLIQPLGLRLVPVDISGMPHPRLDELFMVFYISVLIFFLIRFPSGGGKDDD